MSIVTISHPFDTFDAWREWSEEECDGILEWIEIYPHDEQWQRLMESPAGWAAWQLNRVYQAIQPTLISISAWKWLMAGEVPSWFFFDSLGRE